MLVHSAVVGAPREAPETLGLSTAIHEGRADPEELSAIAAKYSMEVLGPVPEGYLSQTPAGPPTRRHRLVALGVLCA